MESKYLIVGNSVAAIAAIESIREEDKNGSLTVVSDEKVYNYSRPLISYYLGGKIDEGNIYFREKDFYSKNGVKLILGKKAQKLNVNERLVFLSDETVIRFEKLLISTGGKPIIPTIGGINDIKDGIFTFTKLSDTKAMLDYIKLNNINSAVVLGGGLIGLKAAEGLVARGMRVTIIELADRILPNTLDIEASGILERALANLGCSVVKEDTIVSVSGDNGILKKVYLRSGEMIETALLVIAIGVRPNLDLIKDTPINYDRGIVVNDYMQTNIKEIYAAGDVVQAKSFLNSNSEVLALWPVAFRQGRVAGFNMAGKETKYDGLFAMNSVEIAGIPVISFGISNPVDLDGYEVLVRKESKAPLYRKIVIKDGKVIGGIFLGRIDRAGIFLGLLRFGLEVSPFKEELLKDDFGFLVLPKNYRKHMVVGEVIEV
ncbi:MAG: FAD-dependent oxidoreductase [Synergistetes bacterium]|nr:FAD-dependent oxidoreductase [Synergistota bacterium]MCX8128010.1 FAD-dependent oxidoreductase [Synergistota bacterium]MDW8192795.1 FAD-dependent oxidoreductase [Synergistota bacterium]